MKNILNAVIVMVSTWLTSCGDPQQKFSVTVVDEIGSPMKGIECTAGFNRGKASGMGLEPYGVSAKTDASGIVEITGSTLFFDTTVGVKKDGYYPCFESGMWMKKRNGNRWEPWPVKVKLIMKKIGQPHPMYVCKLKNHGRFMISKDVEGPIGFDLLKRDWVAPYGKGERVDLFIEGVKLNGGEPVAPMPGYKVYQGYAHITFPREGDGISPAWEESGGSELLGPQNAPDEGYLKEWKFTNYELPEGKNLNPVRDARTMIFRVRTELDDKGKVVSAIYGKFPEGMNFTYGPFAGGITMIYYFNETPNDRRLEWDMKTNLFKDITSGSTHRP